MPTQPLPSVTHVPAGVSLGSELNDVAINGILASHRQHDGGGSLERHEHGSPYLCVVLAGGYLQAADKDIECRRGSLIAHPPGHVHANLFGSATTRCVNLHLDADWLDDATLSGIFADYRHVRLDSRHDSLARLERELTIRDAGSSLAIASAALDLLGRITRGRRIHVGPGWLHRVRDAIEADLAHPQDVAALASLAGTHPAHLCRAFRESTGETLGGYSRRRRLEEADRMLEGPLSIAEIAAATGFYDQAHLARCFRGRFGISPSVRRTQLAS